MGTFLLNILDFHIRVNMRSAAFKYQRTWVRWPWISLSALDALPVALGKVITSQSLCSSALRAHRLEMIMEGKCALDVFTGENKYFHLVLTTILSHQKGEELTGQWDELFQEQLSWCWHDICAVLWGLHHRAQQELEPIAWGICICDQRGLLLAVRWGFWGWSWHGLKPMMLLNGWGC